MSNPQETAQLLPRPRSGRALATWRKTRAIELALAGNSYDDIAAEVGYKNRGTAWNVVMTALRERTVEGVEIFRKIELARLDAIQSAHWSAATSGGDLKSAELCLRVIAQRTKLLGIEGPPPDMEAAHRTIVISGTSEEYVRQLSAFVEE